jgi:hypothetical protein
MGAMLDFQVIESKVRSPCLSVEEIKTLSTEVPITQMGQQLVDRNLTAFLTERFEISLQNFQGRMSVVNPVAIV